MIKNNTKIIPINKIDKTSKAAIIAGYASKKPKKKLKEFSRSKGNCVFTSNIAHALMDFIYRAVIQLKIRDKKLIFSRGAVKINGISVIHATATQELDWDVGISIRIPYKLNYNKTINVKMDDIEYKIRLMEIIVLSALLRITYPQKKSKWCSDMSVLILSKGWSQLSLISS